LKKGHVPEREREIEGNRDRRERECRWFGSLKRQNSLAT